MKELTTAFEEKQFINLTGISLIHIGKKTIFPPVFSICKISISYDKIIYGVARVKEFNVTGLPDSVLTTHGDYDIYFIVNDPLIMMLNPDRNDIVIPIYSKLNSFDNAYTKEIEGFGIQI